MLKNYYQRAQFLISVGKLSQLPEDNGYEVAFAGRSNAGKSSAINVLTGNQRLARTSNTPGRTQLINFFSIDESRRIVDLPGYGYAKVSREVKQKWDQLLDDYLQQRNCLKGLVLLMDSRHPLKDFDRQFINWCALAKMPVHVLLTKSDKLKRAEASDTLRSVDSYLSSISSLASVQLFSSQTKTGTDNLISILDNWLNVKHNED